MPAFRFIRPADPIEQSLPPTGPEWNVELKWDGYRVQLHKKGAEVFLFSRNGKFMPRFKPMYEPLRILPAKSAIIDAEFVALNSKGLPDFRALHNGQNHSLACFCFDLLELNGKDMRPLPLVKRRKALRNLLRKAAIPSLTFSETYDEDPNALLARIDQLGMEGIVSKLKDKPYTSGKCRSWIKTKTHAWRGANANRKNLFLKP